MAIKIKGVIGYDVIATEFSDKLSKLTGDVEFELASPGGSVFQGIEIANAIKNYNRGKKRIHVVGDCSSMAAYIMLFGDTLDFEPNSVVCIHNPWNCAMGDYKVMQKNAEFLEQLSVLYAQKFIEKGLFEEKEIRQIMDEETWFIGEERLKLLGNVLDSPNKNQDDNLTNEIKIAAFREEIEQANIKVKALKEDPLQRIAALMPLTNMPKAEVIIASTQPEKPQEKLKIKGEKKMKNADELKAQAPEVYAEVVKLGGTEALENERKRVSALMNFIDIDKEATVKAIKEGTDVNDNDFQSSILMAKVKTKEVNAMEEENPAALNPKVETHEPEQGADPQDDAAAKKQQEQLDDILSRM